MVKLGFNIGDQSVNTVEVFLDAKYLDDYDEYSNIKYAELNKNDDMQWQ